jgi:membrane fusion protein (multidrug efflux system)
MKTPFTLTAVALLSVLLVACQPQQTPPARGMTEVGVVTLATQSVLLQNELPGRVTAALSAEVRPQVSGIVQARLFEEGARVKAGQVLYRLDASSYQATVDQALATLASAEASVGTARLKDERYAELAKIEGVAKQDADDAHATYRQALASVEEKKAALATARISLGQATVTAPIAGRIGASSVTLGALVTASQTTALATIRALDPIYIDLTQSSAQLLKLRKLQTKTGVQAGSAQVRLKLEDGSTYARTGTLKFQELAVDAATGSVTLRAQFPNPDGVLLPGMYVRAVLDEAQDSSALLVPQRGITWDPKGNATAMVLGADNKVEQRTVVTDRAMGDRWLVSSGLAAGDKLITEGLNKIRVGDTVKPVDASVGSAASAAAAPAPVAASSANAGK